MKKFGFKIKLDNLLIKLSKLKLGPFGLIRWLTNSNNIFLTQETEGRT